MLAILLRELRYYFKNKSEVIVIINFIVSIALLACFTFPAESGLPRGVAATILWVTLLCASQLAAMPSWQRHMEQGDIATFQLLPWALEWTVLTKLAALYLVTLLPVIVAAPLAGAWMGMQAPAIVLAMVGLAAGALALTAINQMIAGLLAGQRSGAVLGIIALPFSIPVIIVGASYTAQTDIMHGGIVFLMGYGIFLVPISCLATAASLRNSH